MSHKILGTTSIWGIDLSQILCCFIFKTVNVFLSREKNTECWLCVCYTFNKLLTANRMLELVWGFVLKLRISKIKNTIFLFWDGFVKYRDLCCWGDLHLFLRNIVAPLWKMQSEKDFWIFSCINKMNDFEAAERITSIYLSLNIYWIFFAH